MFWHISLIQIFLKCIPNFVIKELTIKEANLSVIKIVICKIKCTLEIRISEAHFLKKKSKIKFYKNRETNKHSNAFLDKIIR